MPLRTARGAGRREEPLPRAADLPRAVLRVAGFFFGGVFRALRVVEVVPVLGFRDAPEDPDVLREVDVLVLRDPGGEDVRVAMPPT
ncbi:hypothetical protein [Nocardioides sp. GXZ039]|uniref:hypothetical protein n=1 Tax=Nocardioides sp. GXZ039 TaxID=3136018 RepID=UPI0030F3A08E